MLSTARVLKPPPFESRSSTTSSGVRTMPKRLETEALHRAAATLPRAIEVKAIEDCTVEGRMQTKISPAISSDGRTPAKTRVSTRPSRGNST